MQQEFTEISQQVSQHTSSSLSSEFFQDGLLYHHSAGCPCRLCHDHDDPASHPNRSASPAASQTSSVGRPVNAGQRVADYENANLSSSPQRAAGFKVVKTNKPLPELPDEVWEHVMSKLDPSTIHSVASVSRRFRHLATTQNTWKMAFMNHFAGRKGPEQASSKGDEPKIVWYDESAPGHPSVRFFARISQMGSWREEFALRTSLLSALSKGKAEIDFHACSARHKDKTQHYPTLTYWPRLDGPVTRLDAVFSDTRDRAPLAIHGSSSNGGVSTGIPLTGRVIKSREPHLSDYSMWFWFRPDSVPYGLGNDPVFMPNVMDVSHKFGSVCFQSYPGGLGCYHSLDGDILWLGHSSELSHNAPRVDRSTDCITATWIAKSNWIGTLTSARIGILAGSAMGFVDGYSFRPTIRQVPGRPPRAQSETISWAVSPGVPIVSIQVDDMYSHKRAAAGRPWAVVLNALGEVFVLSELPDLRLLCADDSWNAARTASWKLVTPTLRIPRLDNLDSDEQKKAVDVAKERVFSPGPAPFRLNQDFQRQNDKIQEFCAMPPSYFREVCHGWDMRRRLEVDFAGGGDDGLMEHIFVITCGHVRDYPPAIRRYTAVRKPLEMAPQKEVEETVTSIFGGPTPVSTLSGGSATSSVVGSGTEWLVDTLGLDGHSGEVLTSSALDMSTVALLTPSEEDLDPSLVASTLLPGRRGRWLCVGRDSGTLLVWNSRFAHRRGKDEAHPIRTIQTGSPSISCIAATALFVIHGGSDGRLCAWDPLGSTLDPVRVLNGKQGNGPVRTLNMHHLMHNNNPAVTAIFLDPDPTKLRGLAASGRVVRCWSYSAAHRVPGRKKRHRFSNAHGKSTGRYSHHIASFIGAEEAELKRERREVERQRKYLQNRFLLADLTEEEAVLYAQLLSEETAQQDDLRRATDQDNSASPSDDVSTNETESEAPSVYISNDQNFHHPSSPTASARLTNGRLARSQDDESDTCAREMELAMRLSLQEVQDQVGESSRATGMELPIPAPNDAPTLTGGDEMDGILAGISAEEDAELRMVLIASLQETHRSSQGKEADSRLSGDQPSTPPGQTMTEDEAFELALSLSLQPDLHVNRDKGKSVAPVVDAFPELENENSSSQQDLESRYPSPNHTGKGKGKGKKGKWVKWSP